MSRDEPMLSGKVALVTGGGRGIGRAIATALASSGARVVIASRKGDVLEAAAASINEAGTAGRVLAIPCHLGRPDQVEALVKRVVGEVGPVDILVNNSATNAGQGPALEVTDEQLDRVLEINLEGPLRLVRGIVPSMMERGGGVVINIASVAGLQPMPGGSIYSASKAALISLTRSWAREFGPRGVRVNAVAPGLIQTDLSAYFWEDPDRREAVLATQSIRRLGQPGDVADLVLYLASDASGFVNGQTFVVDGGYL